MKVMVISAHPDDETLGCGGTLLRHAKAGDSLEWIIATRADEARYGSLAARKLGEVDAVAKAYPMARTHALGYLPAQLDRVPMQELVHKISEIAATVRPELVYTVGPGDVHSDHRVLFSAVEAALKAFRSGDGLRRILAYETLSSTDVRLAPGEGFRPTVFVDISDTLDRKVEILSLYESELQKPPLPRNGETLRALARVRGASSGVHAAEAFQLIREIVQPGARL